MKTTTTIASDFGRIPILDNKPLFQVNPDMPIDYATSVAACLAESIKNLARDGVQQGIDETTSYLIEFAADAIQALCGAAEAGGE